MLNMITNAFNFTFLFWEGGQMSILNSYIRWTKGGNSDLYFLDALKYRIIKIPYLIVAKYFSDISLLGSQQEAWQDK